jgi:hypothetical protein
MRHQLRLSFAMSMIKVLAVLPFLGILVGSVFLNQVTPLVLGLPVLLAWLLLWVVLTSAIMAVIYLADPANRTPSTHTDPATHTDPDA